MHGYYTAGGCSLLAVGYRPSAVGKTDLQNGDAAARVFTTEVTEDNRGYGDHAGMA
jgi:hypothetical protein